MKACEPSPAEIVRLISECGAEALSRQLLSEPPQIPPVPSRSDYDLSPQLMRKPAPQLVPAAVLLPIVRRASPTVLFTLRTTHLARHAGQVSFPGGQLHEGDSSLLDTALRETREETGIGQDHISVAGFLDPYESRTGFVILPVVGVLSEGFRLAPDPNEVALVFEVPLEFLLEPKNCEVHSGPWRGQTRTFYAYTYENHYIWGATAGILVNLRERLCS